jgi:hypothetical protein
VTLDEMIIDVFDNLGRPTDLSPLDELDDDLTINPTLVGYKKLQQWVNLGYEAITKWRTSGGKFYRHNDMIKRKFCQYGPHLLDQTWVEFNPDDPFFTPTNTLLLPEDNYYVGNVPTDLVWVTMKNLGADLEYEDVTPEDIDFVNSPSVNEISSIYANVYLTTDADFASLAYFVDPHTLYLLTPIPWMIPETEVTIYEKGIYINRFLSPGNEIVDDMYAIRSLRVFDPALQTDAELANRTENFTQNYGDLGRATSYYREKQYIHFDWHVPQEFTYQLEYTQEVPKLVEQDDSPIIQVRFHTPIVYWATYRGQLRYGNNDDAYALYRFLDTEMKSIIKEQDLDIERLEGHFNGGGGYYGR